MERAAVSDEGQPYLKILVLSLISFWYAQSVAPCMELIMHQTWTYAMAKSDDRPAIVSRLEQLRDANQWSIAEMARRAGLPRRSMENYFKGHKPGYDALVSMADAFGVPLDFLVGLRDIDVRIVDGRLVDCTEPGGLKSEDIIERAARDELRGFLRFLVHLVERGQRPIKDGRVLSRTPEDQAAVLAKQIAWRASSVLEQYPDEDDEATPEDA